MQKASYGLILRQLREKQHLSQQVVAEKLGLSRTSYMAIEQGTRELSLSEAVTITTLFGIHVDDLVSARIPNEQKYAEMILAIVRAATADKSIIKKTKLSKLLYIVDFSWFYMQGVSMSNIPYRHIEFGPTPDSFFRILDEMEHQGTLHITQIVRDDYHMYEIQETRTSSKQALGLLTSEEQAHIAQVWNAWSNTTTAEILKFTTEQAPYRLTQAGEIIPYEHILTLAPHEIM